MATHTEPSTSEYQHGQMEVAAHQATFHSIMGLTKWGSLATACALILLVVWFCTPAGFIPAFVSALIVAVLGGFMLSRKPKAGH